MSTKAKLSLNRRRVLSSFVALAVAASGVTTSSCAAAPRLPRGGHSTGFPLRAATADYEFQVLNYGVPVQTFERAGSTYVLGELGARYTLRVINHTARRIEAVVSVDGRDAMDGKTANYRTNRGYVVPAWGNIEVDGWRLSHQEVAAFRFSSVADSYAARTGNAREVGVIGVAVFPERLAPQPRAVYTPPRTPRAEHQLDGILEGSGGSRERQAPVADTSAKAEMSDAPLSGRSSSPAPEARKGSDRDSSRPLSRLAPAPSHRPGLGTEFGEAVNSPIHEVSFVRASATQPAAILGARYNDRDGLVALGIDVDACCGAVDEDLAWRQSATPFPVSTRRYAAPPAGWQQGCCMR